jgi:hypothetical protein
MDASILTPVQKLSRDLRNASRTLGKQEARFLVDAYYKIQEDRIRSAHQVRTLAEPKGENAVIEPHEVIQWLQYQEETLEKQIRGALDAYSNSTVVGAWARSITGIGPVIAAGLLANIEIAEAATVGHIWRFAGLDPTSKWIGSVKARELVAEIAGDKRGKIGEEDIARIAARINVDPIRFLRRLTDLDTGEISYAREDVIAAVAKRPWNASLKTLCWKVGESFVKVCNHEEDFYGKLYTKRKLWEAARNERLEYADQAAASLAEKKFGRDTQARKHYEAGRLPPARIHARAERWAVKIFLAHLHEVWWFVETGGLPPKPYVLDHVAGHSHKVEVPNAHLVPGLVKARGRKR